MKRKIFSIFLLLAMTFSAIANDSSSLTPDYCSMGKYLDRPLNFIRFGFNDNNITILGDSTVTLFCDDEAVVSGKLTPNGELYLDAIFDPIMLPKGKIYQLRVPAGAIALESNTSIINEPFSATFEVPEYMPFWMHSVENKKYVVSESSIYFYFRLEAKREDIKVILLRNNIPVRKESATASWDWEVGHVWTNWNKTLNFEKDVHYSLILPKGSICSRNRNEIINKEERIDFIGGYDKPFPELKYNWCSLDAAGKIESLNQIQWAYNQKVSLALSPKIELWQDSTLLLKEVTPTCVKADDMWLFGKYVVTADFEGIPIDSTKTYRIVIPESTVVTPEGDVVVNKEHIIHIVNNLTGIDEINRDALAIICNNNQLRIEGTKAGDPIVLYTIEGKTVTSQLAQEDNTVIELPHRGMFIVVVNGKPYKVVNQ